MYHGKVVGFSAGTGAAFSLLPAQNATGNWIKVVQRVPVRIALDPREFAKHPLRIGLSMQVDVNIKAKTAAARPGTDTAYQTNVFDKYGDEADAEIARIIAENAGPNGGAKSSQRRRRAAVRPAPAKSRSTPLTIYQGFLMAQAQAQVPHPPLEGAQLVIGTIAVSLAVFMNVLDTSIANVSIPSISGDLGVSSDQGTWVITSFAVANAISVPLTGWLTAAFRPGTAVHGVDHAVRDLVVALRPRADTADPARFRVLQGAVAGPMIPLSQTLLLASYPAPRRPWRYPCGP